MICTFLYFIFFCNPNYKKYIYETALELAIKATDNNLKAISVTMDFEKGLINAITSKFPEGKQVLCNFHFKQALRRKLLQGFKISKEIVSDLMDILTTILIDQIITKGTNTLYP